MSRSDSRILDSTLALETPEGIELELEVAGPIVRACAWAVDLAIRAVAYLIGSIVLSLMGNLGSGALLIGIFLIEWFYPVFFEVMQGATPGKRRFGLEVLNDNGTPLSWPTSIVRNLLRVADFLPAFYAVGLVTMLCNREFKRLGDLVAGTVVVYRQDQESEYEVGDGTSVSPPQVLTLSEQRAIMDFAERLRYMSRERGAELADLLSPLSRVKGESAIEILKSYANWLKKGG